MTMLFLLVTLTLAFSVEAFDCPDAWGYHANPADCGSYYQCTDWTPNKHDCQEGTYYDPITIACDWPDRVDCGIRPREGFFCPDAWGFHGNPADCASYFQCQDWVPKFHQCQEGTYYDEQRIACDWPNTVDCGSRPKDGGSGSDGGGDGGNDGGSGVLNSLPLGRIMAIYLSISSDTAPGATPWDDWTPKLYDYQRQAANVLMLTFINPSTMEVPLSFKNMAAKKGSCMDGAVPVDTVLLFSIGGQAYSQSVNPWPWLESQSAAEAMAETVATWPDLYPGMDGVDVDIEHGAGEAAASGPNLVHFLRRLEQLRPDMVIVVPTYGYPQIPAENAAINAAWDQNGGSSGLVDSIGIMVYEGTKSLDWVDEYTESGSFPNWWPITADVPERAVTVGVRGSDASSVFTTVANSVKSRGLGGIIVWYATVSNGAQNLYDNSWDTSIHQDSQQGMIQASNIMA